MAAKNFDPSKGSGSGDGEDEVRPDEEGADAARNDAGASDPDSQPDGSVDEWTVDDILSASQNLDAAAEDAVLADLESALLNDLKRLQAEYANYRRRTEEQRELEIERAKGAVAKGLLPVLDDLDRAEKHGDLVEGSPFTAIAEKLRLFAERLGITSYGEAGEVFDPQRHEAIFQQPTPGAETSTVADVVEAGYYLGGTLLRAAKVVVAVPAD